MNQIQVIGTHNSYHVASQTPFAHAIRKLVPAAADLNYTHAPLDVQLDRGVRQLELDVYHDPAGTKVMHVPVYDTGSTCATFVEGLTTIRDWSARHPRHVPVMVLVELKDEAIPLAPVLPFDGPAIEQLDHEIWSVFKPEQLLLPDEVRGGSPTLTEAVTSKGWPTLDAARGKVLLVMHARGHHAELYTQGRPSLQGWAMFLESQEGKPFAAVFILNDPGDPAIARLVRQGFLVRTRADSSPSKVANGGAERRDTALASAAQFVSTDFPVGEADARSGYVVSFPGGVPVRCNPVIAPPGCGAVQLEP